MVFLDLSLIPARFVVRTYKGY